jgi:hypothetical protein
MSSAFGEARTIPASNEAKRIMKRLVSRDLFAEQRDVWTMGASLGIARGESLQEGKRGTFENINSLDPDGIFGAMMTGLYPDLKPEERLKRLTDFAEWGIREIGRKEENGTLDFSEIGLPIQAKTSSAKKSHKLEE